MLAVSLPGNMFSTVDSPLSSYLYIARVYALPHPRLLASSSLLNLTLPCLSHSGRLEYLHTSKCKARGERCFEETDRIATVFYFLFTSFAPLERSETCYQNGQSRSRAAQSRPRSALPPSSATSRSRHRLHRGSHCRDHFGHNWILEHYCRWDNNTIPPSAPVYMDRRWRQHS